jgi:hypothetical protein
MEKGERWWRATCRSGALARPQDGTQLAQARKLGQELLAALTADVLEACVPAARAN